MAPIKTAPALQQAILSTYIYDIIIAVAFVLVLVLVANLIKWNGGKNDSSGHTRRVWYFVLCAVTILVSVGFDWLFFMRSIKVPSFVGKYVMHSRRFCNQRDFLRSSKLHYCKGVPCGIKA